MTDTKPRRLEDIPLDELIKDRAETAQDILICCAALGVGVTHDRRGHYSVRARLKKNREILGIIDGLIKAKKEIQA